MAVSDVLGGQNLTLSLPKSLGAFPKATPQQKGGAADLSYGTLRFYGGVNACLELLLEKPLSNGDIHSLLLVAIYQLLYDKAEDFTVVNQAVKAAGYAKPRWAKGLVNGVLRNFLRQKDALLEKIKTDEVALYSYPKWWVNKLKTQYPKDWQAILEAGNVHPPMTLRVNRRKSSTQEYCKLLVRQDIEVIEVGAETVMLAKPMPIEQVPGFAEGGVSVQDAGAQLAAQLIDLKTGLRVLDACSAPGGKTGHILELFDVDLTALDNDAKRLQRVDSNLLRLNLQADCLLGDASTWKCEKTFDRILADVPCTASGIVRRHVDIKWLRRESDVVSFAQQQAQILANLWQLLSKGGKLLYVTCSIFAEENQQQVEHFLKHNSDATQLSLELTNDRVKNFNIQHGQLIPSKIHDGFFYALLQKT